MSEPKIEHHYADVGGLLMHYVTAGAGEPLVLLHGWPQTWYEPGFDIVELNPNYDSGATASLAAKIMSIMIALNLK